jgi:hypothetical protein
MSEIQASTPASTVTTGPLPIPQAEQPPGRSLWKDAWLRLWKDPMAIGCLWIVVFYACIALLSKFGLIASPWDKTVGPAYQPPSASAANSVLPHAPPKRPTN